MRDEQIPTMNKSKRHDENSLHDPKADGNSKTFTNEDREKEAFPRIYIIPGTV